MSIYNIDGIPIPLDISDIFRNNVSIQNIRDETTQTSYLFIRVFQNKINGGKQFPFVVAPSGSGASKKSALTYSKESGYLLTMNAGVGEGSTAEGYTPMGVLIQNGELIQQESHPHMYSLTIDNTGILGYAEPNTDGNELIRNGVISAVTGFCPIVVDYVGVEESFYSWISHYANNAQRQIIGQFSNGDYAIISCEGRQNDNSIGWTIPQAISVCTKLGLKFAFNLDGGGSVETVMSDRQFNIIYEGTYGRPVPNYIVFNGTDTFGVPE